MRIYKTGSLAFDYTVGVKEYRCNMIDNIERKFVGQTMKILSWGDILHQSTITVQAEMSIIDGLRESITRISEQGLKFRITAESFEPIFGPEFNYASINSLTNFQLLSEADEPYQISSTIDGILSEWTFTIGSQQTITPYYKYLSQSEFPSGMRIERVSRVKNSDTVVRGMYFSQSSNGFNVSTPQAVVTYAGQKEDVAKAKSYFMQQCLLSYGFLNFGPRVWLFEKDSMSANVFVLSMEDLGPISNGSDEFRFNVTLALAVT